MLQIKDHIQTSLRKMLDRFIFLITTIIVLDHFHLAPFSEFRKQIHPNKTPKHIKHNLRKHRKLDC